MSQWRIYIRELGNPGSKDKRTKVHGSQADMNNRANYLNKMMARRHGDGKYHAYIVEEQTTQETPMIIRTYTFRCYDDIGRPVPGFWTEEEAHQQCQIHEGWTYAEVR